MSPTGHILDWVMFGYITKLSYFGLGYVWLCHQVVIFWIGLCLVMSPTCHILDWVMFGYVTKLSYFGFGYVWLCHQVVIFWIGLCLNIGSADQFLQGKKETKKL